MSYYFVHCSTLQIGNILSTRKLLLCFLNFLNFSKYLRKKMIKAVLRFVLFIQDLFRILTCSHIMSGIQRYFEKSGALFPVLPTTDN